MNQEVEPQLNCGLFFPELDLDIRYNQGWEKTVDLEKAIDSKLERDMYRGTTSVGPHKADIGFYFNGKNANEFLSRGQLRILVSLLLLAEVHIQE